eukprot:8828103-Lingulodinium_polyedra.AAC.1
MILILRGCWDTSKYRGREGGRAEGNERGEVQLDLELLTDTLKSNWFFAFMDTLLALHQTLQSLASWSEGCFCHEFMVGHPQHGRPRTSSYQVTCSFDTFEACPLKCLRAPELAAGAVLRKFSEFAEVHLRELRAQAELHLTVDELGALDAEYHTGIAVIEALLRVKTGFWQKLPWI